MDPIRSWLPVTIQNGQSWEFGKLFYITGSANTDITITHNLGRIPYWALALFNGTSYVPKTKVGGTAWTTTTATIQCDVAPTNCLVWVR